MQKASQLHLKRHFYYNIVKSYYEMFFLNGITFFMSKFANQKYLIIMAKRILIVDDEPDILEILRFNLEMEGYDVVTSEAPYDMKDELPDLILLDVMMTPKSGFEWARELKANRQTAQIPIIFCTAKTAEDDMLKGFELGSDDYIYKPFRISEVKARVKAVLRRTKSASASSSHYRTEIMDNSAPHNILTFSIDGDTSQPTGSSSANASGAGGSAEESALILDLDRKECRVDGTIVAFTKLEFEVLALLLSSPGQVFSREKILSTVWPNDSIVLDRTVDVNITRIRKKIGRYGDYLKTRFGYGYLFEK